jgi:hypothetical protein
MVTIPIKKIVVGLFAVLLCMTVTDLILGYNGVFSARHPGHMMQFHRLLHLFDLGDEGNMPTWFKSAILGLAALLLALIGGTRREARDRFAWYWFFMSATFLLLSLNETASLHKAVDVLVSRHVQKSGLFVHAWLIPASMFAVVFVVINWKFLGALPRATGNLFVLSGTLFVLGAVGVKLIEGIHASTSGLSAGESVNMRAFSQLLEMAGILLFDFSLLAYCRDQMQGIRIRLT